jgi:hypothetical protein
MLPPLLHRIAALMTNRPRVERRGAKRETPGALTPCQIRRVGDSTSSAAWIQDLSKTGVGFLCSLECQPGTMLQIVIINAAHTFSLSGEIRVVRCSRAIHGKFILGGEFTNELQHDQMVPFIL